MEPKKTPKANLEDKRILFFEFGLVISILICLYGFESKSGIKPSDTLGILTDQAVEEIVIPITKPEETKPELPPPPKVVDLLLIVENNAEIIDELEIIDTEVTSETAIHAAMYANKPESSVDETVVFLAPEEMPEFPGGYGALLNFLGQNIKYPTIAAENGVSGRVTVNFVVNKDGSISDAKILRGVDQALDKEAIRLVCSMPKWKPGKQSGKPVRVSYSVPISFRLQ